MFRQTVEEKRKRNNKTTQLKGPQLRSLNWEVFSWKAFNRATSNRKLLIEIPQSFGLCKKATGTKPVAFAFA